ncbi:hypothetical protein ACFLWR_06680 [Chloroflexota bacterium]
MKLWQTFIKIINIDPLMKFGMAAITGVPLYFMVAYLLRKTIYSEDSIN